MKTLRFTIEGRPVPCQRARVYFDKRSGKRRGFTPDATREYEQRVRLFAIAAVARARWTFNAGDRFWFSVRIYRAAERGDWDNFAKAIADGMNEVVWPDDRCVDDAHVQLFVDRIRPRAEVEVTRLTSHD